MTMMQTTLLFGTSCVLSWRASPEWQVGQLSQHGLCEKSDKLRVVKQGGVNLVFDENSMWKALTRFDPSGRNDHGSGAK